MRFSTALICLLLAGLALPADAHDFSAGALKILHPWARATAAGARNAICDSGWYRQ
jgi:copper(I)-binding protein